MGNVSEGGLPVLAERNGLVRLEGLKPRANRELMPPPNQRHPIFKGEQVPRNAQVASVIATRQSQLCLRIRCGTSTDDYRADRMPQQETGDAGSGSSGSCLAGEKVSGAGITHSSDVQSRCREG